MNFARRLVHTTTTLAFAASIVFASLSAEAALVARDLDGDNATAEAFYDTALGITWMRDARRVADAQALPATMNYAAATSAIASFNTDVALNFGHSGWRLPGASGVHTIGGAGCQFGFNGSTDCGENVDTASSELAYMFHTNLGNQSWRDTGGAARAGVSGVDWGLVNAADFDHLDSTTFWSSTTSYRLIFNMPQTGQVAFNMANGTQAISPGSTLNAVWLVHDGDIGGTVLSAAAVPLPGTVALVLLGLGALARRARRAR